MSIAPPLSVAPPPDPAARWISELRANPTHHDLLAAFDLLEKTADPARPRRPGDPRDPHDLSQKTADAAPDTAQTPNISYPQNLSQRTSDSNAQSTNIPPPHRLPRGPADAAPNHLPGAPDPVRFIHSPELALPLGELLAVAADPEDPARHLLTTAGAGPCGPSSPLPLALADELAAAPLALAALDLFHHRRTLLLCRGLLAADLAGSLDGADPWSDRLIALVGLAGGAFTPIEALRLAPVFAAADRSPRALAVALRRLLPDLCAAPTLRCELVPDAWTALADDQRSRLGQPAACLGDTAALGAAVRLPSASARLYLGPLPAAALPALSPGGRAHARLRALLAAFLPDAMTLELVLELEDMSLPTCSLGQQVLGRDLWLRPDPARPRLRQVHLPLTSA